MCTQGNKILRRADENRVLQRHISHLNSNIRRDVTLKRFGRFEHTAEFK